MKFSGMHKILAIILFALLPLPAAFAEGNRDFMRETGKINVVTAVIVVIFLGIVWYMIRLERKLTKLEHQLQQEEHERKN